MITTLVSEALLCGSVGMTTCKVAVATLIAHNHTAKDGIYSHIRSVRHVATVSRTKLETRQQQLRATLDRHTNHPYLQQLVCTCTCECADNGPTGRPGNLQPPWPATDWHMTRVCMIEEETLRALMRPMCCSYVSLGVWIVLRPSLTDSHTRNKNFKSG